MHRADCANAVSLMTDQSARVIDVDWDGDASGQTYRAGVEVVALDRSHLLRDVANALSDQHVNIVACSTHTGNDRVAKMRFEFELGRPRLPRARVAHHQADRRRLRRLSPGARPDELTMALVRRPDRVRHLRALRRQLARARQARSASSVPAAGERGGLGADFKAWGGSTALFNEAIRQAISNTHDRNSAADASDHAAATFDVCPNCGASAWTEHKERRRSPRPRVHVWKKFRL